MKNRLFSSLALFLLFFLSITSTQAQAEFNIATGYGLPRMGYVEGRLQLYQNQFGLSVGTNLGYKHENYSLSGDYYYHFGGESDYTNLRPWYGKAGLTFMQSQDEWEQHTNLLLVPRLGREFNITEEFGVALEAGIMLMLMDKNTAKQDKPDSYTGDLDVIGSDVIMASAGFKIYYRFLQ